VNEHVIISIRYRSGTFLGRARVHNSGKLVDLSSALLGAGLARLHPTFQPDRQPGGPELLKLEQAAKDKRLKVLRHQCMLTVHVDSSWRLSLSKAT
jgi:hypothetical protein